MSILKDAKHHSCEKHAGDTTVAKSGPHSSKQHARGSIIVRDTRLAVHAHLWARGQGMHMPFRRRHKRQSWRKVGGGAQHSLSGPHSSKQHARCSIIVSYTRLETHGHLRACGQGVRAPLRTRQALAGQTRTVAWGSRGVKDAPEGACARMDDEQQ